MASKRYKKLPEKTKDLNAEAIEKLLPEVKKNCTTKFDESLDLSFQINNKQKKSEVNIRTVVNLPGGTGKKVKVAVVCEDSKAQEAAGFRVPLRLPLSITSRCTSGGQPQKSSPALSSIPLFARNDATSAANVSSWDGPRLPEGLPPS